LLAEEILKVKKVSVLPDFDDDSFESPSGTLAYLDAGDDPDDPPTDEDEVPPPSTVICQIHACFFVL
jgi:hypothetical protein